MVAGPPLRAMHVTVLGAGTMGQGIAQVAAQAGHAVTLRDVDRERVDAGLEAIESTLAGGVEREKLTRDDLERTLATLSGTTDLEAACTDADLLVEAVPEDTDLKRDVLGEAERHVPDDAILASNTSSLSITGLADALRDPGRFLGLHFFNPVHQMALVEVVTGERTTDETVDAATAVVEGLGKTPITVRDSPGFATSRLGVALGAEAIRLVETGVAGPRAVDRAMALGYNHPMGPIELGDVVGLDVRLDILEHLREELGERFRPPQLLKQKVRAGKLGKKTGEGFYVWSGDDIVGVSGDPDAPAPGGERP